MAGGQGGYVVLQDILEWLVPILAVYGAGLSTYNIWSTHRRKKLAERRILKVGAAYGIPIYDDGADRSDLVVVSVTNIGQRNVIGQ